MLINILWLLTSIFMILVILVQRGKGGGLAGALGGVGGSSAFGTRAGDLFTKITVGVFLLWLFLGMSLVPLMTRQQVFQGGAEATNTPALNPNPTEPGAGGPPGGPAPAAPATDAAENKAPEKSGDSGDSGGVPDKGAIESSPAEADAQPSPSNAPSSDALPPDTKGPAENPNS